MVSVSPRCADAATWVCKWLRRSDTNFVQGAFHGLELLQSVDTVNRSIVQHAGNPLDVAADGEQTTSNTLADILLQMKAAMVVDFYPGDVSNRCIWDFITDQTPPKGGVKRMAGRDLMGLAYTFSECSARPDTLSLHYPPASFWGDRQ